MERNEWIKQFVNEMKSWPAAKGFVRDGGVPGCRIPGKISFQDLAEWFLTHPPDGYYPQEGHDPRMERHPTYMDEEKYWVSLDIHPKYAVEKMIKADNAYSPDY
ncbi:MAG TPA: hypothetical protein DCY27_01825 [Desulfobacterales bacterium]|nr:hypothetical protein [Desulfobacterales bacterium]